MKVNITEKSRELYGANCPLSTEKCESIGEIDYKLQRLIDLGKHVKTFYDSRGKLVQILYHNNLITLHRNEIVNIQKSNKCYEVTEKRKIAHYIKSNKVII